MSSKLSAICRDLKILESRGPEEAEIRGLAYDSRAIEAGFLFFALPGLHADGRKFVDAAIAAGAVAVIHEGELASYAPGVSYLRVTSSRSAMSPVAAAFHDSPSTSLAVIGVTGTEGKSTTVYLIYQLLKLSGRKAGFFSTVMSDTGSGEAPNPEHQTTPEATAVQRMLAAMRDAGCEFAVVEASSHGLSPRLNRLGDVAFDVGVFMNVTHEHLEFHGTWEQYRDDKANLFRALDRFDHVKTVGGATKSIPSFGVACVDDPSAPYFAAVTKAPTRTFGSKGRAADFRAFDIRTDASGSSFTIEAQERRLEARIELPGAFNVDNSLAALIAVSGITGRDWTELLPLLPQLKPVRGRMERIDQGQDFEVIVDYAHTPSSFMAIFPSLKARTGGRLISLFGSGGERDVEKRPQQGKIAAEYCDIIFLADEDPRGEDPTELLEAIAAGCPQKKRGEELFIIPDRPSAIRKAFSLARRGDIVLLLGKGHENSIIYKNRSIPYDEIAEAEKALGELGYPKSHKEKK